MYGSKYPVLLALLVACSSSSQFREGQNGDFEIDEKVDPDPVTVNRTPGGEVDIDGPGAAPAGFWRPRKDDFVLRDVQTGSLWNLRGEAYEGPLAGRTLNAQRNFNAFWFAFSIFYDGAEVFGRDRRNETSNVRVADGECLVPCDEIRLGCGGGLDCIPALDYDGVDGRPVAKMVQPGDAAYLGDNDFVFGVVVDGEARAYPHNIFGWHEIYNDKIGDYEFSVTFCPLTGSGIVFSGMFEERAIDFGVSGNLYNSNLVMFDRPTRTFWSQMLMTGITGTHVGKPLTHRPIVETTWQRWKQMWPDTKVASDDQGYSRSYNSYPYGDYRTDHGNTFRPTNPSPDSLYDGKDRTMGVFDGDAVKLYAFEELEKLGDRVVVNDSVGDSSVLVVYETQHRLALAFSATLDGQTLSFEGARAE
jgi:hypothetical protein